MAGPRLTPTLLDKLTVDMDLDGLTEEGASPARVLGELAAGPAPPTAARIERYSEQALRAAVRRELAWLFNTSHLASVDDLTPFPEVRTSVLNYGVPSLAGKSSDKRLLMTRAKELRRAILAFEPRLNPANLTIDVIDSAEHDNAVTYVVRGDVVGAVQALAVQYQTDVEIDTGVATVKG